MVLSQAIASKLQQQQQCHTAGIRCSGIQQQQQSSFYCSRAVVEALSEPNVLGCGRISGPIDVEDLASFCNFSSQATCEYAQPAPLQQPHQPQPQQVSITRDDYRTSESTYIEQVAFAYCTDSRWLSCPATSYCPLYDTSQRPIESWNELLCGEQLYGYCAADDEALDEYLSNEKRKEKSRDAARCRRSRETDIFMELAAALPLSSCEVVHLDKASVMRLAIAFLKTRNLLYAVPKLLAKSEMSSESDELFLKALDGFVLVLDNNGDIAYLSPNVKDYLGIAQMDLMGQSVFDYSHPCDHDEIRESLSIKASEIDHNQPCNIFLRFKCTLTSKGRKVNLKSASYKVIHCVGRLIAHSSTNVLNSASTDNVNDNKDVNELENHEKCIEKEPSISLVVVASPVPHPSNIEVPLGKSTFLSKHNLNMKFTYADDKLAEFLGWESSDLMGQSVFEFYHALDNMSLDKSFKSLFHKGQCETMAYRFLNKKGGYAWVVTQATLIHCSRLQKPLSVVCVNYLLSDVECKDEIYCVRQLEARESRLKKEDTYKRSTVVPTRKPLVDKPQIVTASLLHPHTSATVSIKSRANNKENKSEKRQEVKVKVREIESATVQSAAAPSNYVSSPSISPNTSLYQSSLPLLCGNRPIPQTATASIFAPRTEDMNTGFLMFCEDQPGFTMLKDEPEDLTHLAPTAGDVCVPLDDPPFLSDMLDEFILSSNYCPLLSPELSNEPSEFPDPIACANSPSSNNNSNSNKNNNNITSNCSNNGNTSNSLKDLKQTILSGDALKTDDCDSSDGDPFIYRDSSSRCSLGTDLHSPLSSKSPESIGGGDSLGSRGSRSLNSYSKGETRLSDDDGLLSMNFNDMMCDDELEMRAPYIPMCDQDETLQMLMFDDMVMWSPSETEKKPKLLTDAAEDDSSLAQLLTSESKQIKSHDNLIVNPAQVSGQISTKDKPIKNTTVDRERTHKRMHSFTSKTSLTNKRIKHNVLDTCSHNSSNDNAGNSNLSSLEKMLSSSAQSSQLLQQLVSQQVPKSRIWQDHVTPADQMKNRFHAEDNSNNSSGTTNRDLYKGSNHEERITNRNNSLFSSSNLRRLNDEGGGGGEIKVLRSDLLEDDGGGKLQQQQQQQQEHQSNSVLMNLLVSGCDVQNPSNQLQDQLPLAVSRVTALPPDKLSLSSLYISGGNQQHQLHRVSQWLSSNRPLLLNEMSPGPMTDKILVPPSLVQPSSQQPPPPISVQPSQASPTSFDTLGYNDFINVTSALTEENELLSSFETNLM